jgi:hypothetical protein
MRWTGNVFLQVGTNGSEPLGSTKVQGILLLNEELLAYKKDSVPEIYLGI